MFGTFTKGCRVVGVVQHVQPVLQLAMVKKSEVAMHDLQTGKCIQTWQVHESLAAWRALLRAWPSCWEAEGSCIVVEASCTCNGCFSLARWIGHALGETVGF